MRRVLLTAILAALLLAPGASAWTWPAAGPVLQPFQFDPSHPYAAGQHRGVDLGGAEGSTVLAPAAGTVSFAGTVPSSGKSVTIETPDGYSVTLTHLGSINVDRNAAVTEGGPVGTIGPSGDGEVAQPYVHLGVRLTAQAQGYLDPLTLLPPRGAAPPVDPAPAPSPAPVPPPAAAPAPAPPSAAPVAAPAPTATATHAPAPVASPAPAPATPPAAAIDPSPATVVAASAAVPTVAVPAHGARLRVDAAPAARGTGRHGIAQPGVPHMATAPRAEVGSTPRVAPAPRSSTIAARAHDAASGNRASRSVARPRAARLDPSLHAPSVRNRPVAAHRAWPAARLRHAQQLGAPRAAPVPSHSRAIPVSSPAGFLLALPLVLGVMGLAARRRKGAPIIAPDALLRDHADLLRERQAAHWPRVHHDRGRHPRAASSSARRRDLLPHRRRRARDEGLAGR